MEISSMAADAAGGATSKTDLIISVPLAEVAMNNCSAFPRTGEHVTAFESLWMKFSLAGLALRVMSDAVGVEYMAFTVPTVHRVDAMAPTRYLLVMLQVEVAA